jgi:CheY-like chemotaxis protein
MAAAALQTILVVEDNDDDFVVMERALRRAGPAYPITRCSNGDMALDYLYRRGDYAPPAPSPRPCIILLDLNKPATDGRQVLRMIKADPDLKKIPMVVLTTSSAERDVEECYAAGANSFIQKHEELSKFVEAIVRMKTYWFEVAILPKPEAK